MNEPNSTAKLTACVLLLCFGGMATARTFVVPKPTGDPLTDRANIQWAVDSADEGDTVRFRKGRYVLGDDSDFIVLATPGVRLIGHRRGTTIVGGDVPPTEGQLGSPYLMGNNSLLQSPPRGLYLTGNGQRVKRIRFESFRTGVLIGYGDSMETGGYVIEDCEFAATMYGINAALQSDNVTNIRRNRFLNVTFPYDISGGRYHVNRNYFATPDPGAVPVDDFTHHAGTTAAGAIPFFEEGTALIAENNVFEHNVAEGIAEGIQIFGDVGGIIRNNIFRNNAFFNMQECPNWALGTCLGTFSAVVNFGGDIVDNVWVENILEGTAGVPFIALNFGGTIDGNVIVSNELRSIANVSRELGNSGTPFLGAANTILLDNVITSDGAAQLGFGVEFVGGHANQFLLNVTDAAKAALFDDSPDGVFVSANPNDEAVDTSGTLERLESNQDFSSLLGCTEILTESGNDDDREDYGSNDDDDNDDATVAQLVERFKSCVDVAVDELR